jgi:ZIP family zinc transporter
MIAPGIATGIGGLFILVLRRPSGLVMDTMLGFTAGIMLAAAVFSLLVPSLERGSLLEVVIGFLLGCVLLAGLDRLIPHAHARFIERGQPRGTAPESSRATLLLSALTIHNVPEGMAVGVAFAAGGPELGIPIALAILIQNIPEGFAAAAPLVPLGVSTSRILVIAALTGLVEPPAALAAYAAFDLASGLLAGSLAFAAGAMIYVVVDELIPEAHGRGYQSAATAGLVAGFVVMMTLDNAL